MVVLVLGVALALVHPDSGAAAFRGPHHNLLMKALALDPRAVTGLGILLLLLTPVFRVFAAVITFGLERDLKYFLISSGVLMIVLASIAFSVG